VLYPVQLIYTPIDIACGGLHHAAVLLSNIRRTLMHQKQVPIILMTVMFVALAACQTIAPVGQPLGPSATATATSPDDGIMLVFYRELSFEADVDDIADETRVIECAGDSIRRDRPQQRIVSFEEFRRTAFPDLPPESAPRNPKYLSILLQRTDFQERIRPLGIRHIAFIGGVTKTTENVFIECQRIPGTRNCMEFIGLGLITWEKKSRLGATVLDLKYSRRTENLNASSSGTSWNAQIAMIYLGFPSDTVGPVCRDLGTRLAHYLNGKIPPGQKTDGTAVR